MNEADKIVYLANRTVDVSALTEYFNTYELYVKMNMNLPAIIYPLLSRLKPRKQHILR